MQSGSFDDLLTQRARGQLSESHWTEVPEYSRDKMDRPSFPCRAPGTYTLETSGQENQSMEKTTKI